MIITDFIKNQAILKAKEVAFKGKKAEFNRANTNVGVSLVTNYGRIFTGHNLYTGLHLFHAETNAIGSLLADRKEDEYVIGFSCYAVEYDSSALPCGSCNDQVLSMTKTGKYINLDSNATIEAIAYFSGERK